MDILDRLIAHDTWTTRQLLLACQPLPDSVLDREFEIDHRSLRKTFMHIIENMEIWTALLCAANIQPKTSNSILDLLERLTVVSRDFAKIARHIARSQRFDDCFVDTLDTPPTQKTFGGAIGHVITHNMHHRAQVMFLMEKVGIQDHIEGDLLSWESQAFGWR